MKKFEWNISNGWLRLIAGILASLLIVGLVGPAAARKDNGKNTDGLYYQVTGLHPDGIVMEINGEPITVEEYLYCVTNDCNYLVNYAGVTDLSASLTDEMTYADYVRSDVLVTVRLYGCLRAWAKSLGLEITEEQRAELEEQRASYVEYYGGEEEYLQQLAAFGISEECFDRLNETPYLYELLMNEFIEEDGSLHPDEATLAAFMEKDRALTVTMAYLVQDEQWSEEEQREKIAAFSRYEEELKQAKDKATVMERLLEEIPEAKTENMTFRETIGDPISDAAAALAVGESSGVVESNGTYFLIWRQEVDMKSVTGEYADQCIQQERDNATVVFHDEIYNAIDVATFYPALAEAQQTVLAEAKEAGEEK